MPKVSRTYRLPELTTDLIKQLGDFFNESDSEIIERAIDVLEREKKQEAQRIHDERMKKIQK